ncbi:hypothetical protein ACJJTC_011410 [Scirpophaga incertulas]
MFKNTASGFGQGAQTSRKRAPRSLREKVLTKSAALKTTKSDVVAVGKVDNEGTKTTPLVVTRDRSSPNQTQSEQPKPCSQNIPNETESDNSFSMPMSVVTKIHEWDCEELPPRPIVSEEDEDESDSFSSYSGRPQRTPQNSRPSMLAMPSKSGKGKGVEMDMVTKLANEMLQKGKEAFEMAANMKNESKVAVIESLQMLYETVTLTCERDWCLY